MHSEDRSILTRAWQIRPPESPWNSRALWGDVASDAARSGMIPTMKALESGRAQFSAAEQRRYADAAAYLRRRCGTEIVLAEPLSVEEVLSLELTRIALGGDLERVDQIIDEIEEMIRARLRPH